MRDDEEEPARLALDFPLALNAFVVVLLLLLLVFDGSISEALSRSEHDCESSEGWVCCDDTVVVVVAVVVIRIDFALLLKLRFWEGGCEGLGGID
jgi:hypothetical protein